MGEQSESTNGRPLKVGVILPETERQMNGGSARWSDLREMAQLGEQIGADSLWITDHLIHRVPGEEPRGMWECWSLISALAAITERPEIGTLVLSTSFRNPALLAKMAEAIDEISDGRFILGLGAGWHLPEYEMFGFPFDHRVSRFEEALAIIHPLLRDGRADLDGTYFQARQAVNLPRGPRASGPPILVGSNGHRMLRLTARYADAWNAGWHKDPAAVVPLMVAVDEACREAEREPATLVRTAGANIALPGYLGRRPDPVTGGPEEIAATLRGFRDLGIQHFVCGLDPCTPASIEWFAQVIALLDAES